MEGVIVQIFIYAGLVTMGIICYLMVIVGKEERKGRGRGTPSRKA